MKSQRCTLHPILPEYYQLCITLADFLMSTTAIYPGTFDPITCGHIDLIMRAAQLFDHIIIAIAANPSKKPLFDLETRIALTQAVFKDKAQISAEGFTGLMVDFAKEKSANVVLRGLRATCDFDFEMPLAQVNRHLHPALETLFLVPSPEVSFISSTFVRDIATHHGNLSGLVPDVVARALREKLS